jgi:UDP-N-acetylglucosamine--N-acetylmuramyl-(pentapeptide) pyrophosphoryl-undecaprenol N-acetylglucosamine transferase
MGGYASAPAIVAGRLLGISSAIHEQNAMPGLTNRVLGHFVNRVFLTYPESGRFFSAAKTVVTGNPVRKQFHEGSLKAEGKNSQFTVFVFGGSRGAHRINEVVSEAMTGPLKAYKIRLIHQTGYNDLEGIKRHYEEAGIDAEVRPFIDDMLDAYMRSDLVICRAGATTIAELLALGKPSLLIPYPFAADDHQAKNAAALAKAGGAEMILESELGAELLAEKIKLLMNDEERLCHMGKLAAELARKDTTRVICEELQKLAA